VLCSSLHMPDLYALNTVCTRCESFLLSTLASACLQEKPQRKRRGRPMSSRFHPTVPLPLPGCSCCRCNDAGRWSIKHDEGSSLHALQHGEKVLQRVHQQPHYDDDNESEEDDASSDGTATRVHTATL
jgi:hypothetical protein